MRAGALGLALGAMIVASVALSGPAAAQDAAAGGRPVLSETIRTTLDRDGVDAAERRFHEILRDERERLWAPAAASQEAPVPREAPAAVGEPGELDPASAGGMRISGFLSGPVCHREDGTSDVCQQAVDIDVRGESLCKWSGDERRCTWFGFQFDYENADPDVPIECDYTRSAPSTEGSYEGVRQRHAEEGTFTFELEAERGRFFNPMFELHGVPPDGATMYVTTTLACTYRDEPLFEMTFRARYSGDW